MKNANFFYTVWIVQAEEAEKAKQAKVLESLKLAEDVKAQKEAMRREAGLPPKAV